jgi:non-specific serine/threonine protein kinase
MMFLRDFGVGGILADDMGLGKTIQVLALFRKIQEKTGSYPSSLVVAPRSVITNWERETKRFIPGISVYTHHGMDRASDLEEWPDKDLAITTYGTMRRDIDWLKENDFDYVILDESQAIRNPDTKTSRAAKKIQAANRLCLSGTPVQNTTLDLWSQFEFLNPGYLGSRNRFEETFVRGIEADQAEQVTNQLRSLVDPFMLRRTKERVENELPPISQSILECPMEDEQRELYEQTRSAYHTALKEDMENKSSNEVRFKTLEGLTRLRQICCHPDLVGEDHGYSTKLEQFRRKAREVIQEGHRILVFSQFVEFLEQIENDVQEMDWEYEYLDGQTRNRQERVDRFQNNKDIPLFLISLKAGGEGLNLTGADYVFLMDPWWNPAVERQATDRTHRIGQSKRVFVYRFICPDTVEEKILELQKKKRTIANDVITPEADLFKNLSQDDITTLFS